MKRNNILMTVIISLAAVGAAVYLTLNRSPQIRHVVLISIDTCRADYLGCYGYPQNTTPNIDALAKRAVRFEHTVSPVPITLPAHCSMLTGTIPLFHGVHNNAGYQLASSHLTLAEILKQNDFTTAAIVSAFVLDSEMGLNQGFDFYDDNLGEDTHCGWLGGSERKGDATTKVALNFLEEHRNAKSFLFLHYYDPHETYSPPEPFASDYSDNLYAGEVAFTDACIGQVIRHLKELGIYDSTLLIVTADHGEMLGEHGETDHAFFVYESAIRVPLIIKMPGQSKGTVISEPVGLVDIVPTICSLLDVEIPSGLQGVDISGMLQGVVGEEYERYLYSESARPSEFGASWLMAISSGRWKYIQAPRRELYDVYADPAEERNLCEQEHHRVRILEDKLQQIIRQSTHPGVSSQKQLGTDAIRRLESLGYVAGTESGEADIIFDENQVDPKDIIHLYERYKDVFRLMDRKEYAQARRNLESLIPEWPEFSRIYVLLGDIGLLEGDYNAAVVQYRKARAIDPAEPSRLEVCNDLAWLQATRPSLPARDVEEAVLYAQRVCKASEYKDPNALDTLAVVYAASGDFKKALSTASKARRLALEAGNNGLAVKIGSRQELFEQSKPYIEE